MKKIVFFSLLALLSFDINAKNASEDSITTKNSFVVTRFKSNWFLNFGANANVYLGQNDSKLVLGKRIAPGFTISAGKWVTPWIRCTIRIRRNAIKRCSSCYGNDVCKK